MRTVGLRDFPPMRGGPSRALSCPHTASNARRRSRSRRRPGVVSATAPVRPGHRTGARGAPKAPIATEGPHGMWGPTIGAWLALLRPWRCTGRPNGRPSREYQLWGLESLRLRFSATKWGLEGTTSVESACASIGYVPGLWCNMVGGGSSLLKCFPASARPLGRFGGQNGPHGRGNGRRAP